MISSSLTSSKPLSVHLHPHLLICLASYNDYSQGWRYVADRTGVLSYANLPVMWIFAGRNNIFLLATGWEFSTFGIFHRHIGVIATVQAIVHSVAYTVGGTKGERFP